jgi:hypothetical protein
MLRIARICLLIPIVFPVLSNAASYTFVTFDYPGATATVLSGINNAGQIVGSFFTATTYLQGFIRNADGSLVPIALPFPFTDSPASGINSSGQVVGASFYSGTFAVQGYLRSTVGTYSTIDDPVNPNNNGAFGINDGGMIVGSYADTSNPAFGHGFLRDTGGNFTTIDDPNMATTQTVTGTPICPALTPLARSSGPIATPRDRMAFCAVLPAFSPPLTIQTRRQERRQSAALII